MIPSSSSGLSSKSQGLNRPPSSLSSRPPSRNASRPASSATQRPASSLLVRPTSSASTRPQSRFSQRPHSRHARSRLIPFCQSLVAQVTGLQEGGNDENDDFREAVEYAIKNLENSTLSKAAVGVDISVVDRQISGHALKARINSQDALAEAMEVCYKRLKSHLDDQENDLDQTIKAARLPDHLQFLIALSRQPTDSTLEFANSYLDNIANPPAPPKPLTWADILADDPFEGEHWEGVYGLPAGSVRLPSQADKGDRDGWDSSPSLSPLNSDDLALDDESSSDYEEPLSPTSVRSPSPEPIHVPSQPVLPHAYEHRKQFEELQAKQYWRDDWHTDANPDARFNIGDPSTLGPALSRVLARASGHQDAHAMLSSEKYIDEDDMVREVLMALQGNKNFVLNWTKNGFSTTPSTPRLIHLSLASQDSILTSLAKTATTAQHLRGFTSGVFLRSFSSTSRPSTRSHVYSRKTTTTRTCEAFADAVDHIVRNFDSWCASREEAMVRATLGADEEPLVVSLLATEKAIRDKYEDVFEVLFKIIQEVFQVDEGHDFSILNLSHRRLSPAVLTAFLLDTLFASVQRHMERRDTVTSNALMSVFVRTAEPVWGMIGRWLQDGMGLGLGLGSGGTPNMADELDDEFFIESSGVGIGVMSIGLLDPEFWKEGYALRDGVPSGKSATDGDQSVVGSSLTRAIPRFLEHVASMVLGAGKAVGLIRALGIKSTDNTFANWKSFANLVASENRASDQKNMALFSVSVDRLSQLIYDELLPYSHKTGGHLVKLLVDDCGFWKHLISIEDLYLMRKGDTMSHFLDVLFAKMDSPQAWGDFHFLNTAFNDVIEANLQGGSKDWIMASLVRLSFRGNREKEKSVKRTVKAIDKLSIEYSIPFPLTYIFQPAIIQGYCQVFVFLLQIRRAKSVLERILVRGERGRDERLREELKVFYAMRSRLSWFINTLLNFLTIYVIHAEVSRFHDALKAATLFDELIQLHEEHLEKMRGRCLLKPNTSALHRAIISILDMCLHFSDAFMTLAGDTTTTLDVSLQSVKMKRHRSRRQRRQRRNVIGFSQYPQEEDDSSEEEEQGDTAEDGLPNEPPETSFSGMGSSVLSVEEDFFTRVEKMSSELDGLVRFLRRGVESLAGGTSEAAPAFGVLAFALEDWDI